MKVPAASIAFAALMALAPAAHAQGQAAAAPAAPQIVPDTEKIKQVIVYGNDPCPDSGSDEITVCARLPDSDRFRIPQELRTDPNDPRVQAWANRAKSIEYVGQSGTQSCSPVGAGGFTGCFQQISRAAREERRTMLGSSGWADLVAKERQKRLSTIDAESAAIEAKAKAEEAKAEEAKGQANAPAANNAQPADNAVPVTTEPGK
jgi:hypothetical protein